MIEPETQKLPSPLRSGQINAEIVRLLCQLQEGDRLRLLSFARAMIEQRKGKRQQRQRRFTQP